jgi:hypothetical protein
VLVPIVVAVAPFGSNSTLGLVASRRSEIGGRIGIVPATRLGIVSSAQLKARGRVVSVSPLFARRLMS